MDIRSSSTPPPSVKRDYDQDVNYESSDSEYQDAHSRSSSVSLGRDAIPLTKPDYSRPRATMSPPKRQAEPLEDENQAKRPKLAFNHHYMNLLNADIEDCANRLILDSKRDKSWKLWPSQVGLTVWTPLEKEIFFDAIARLGRDDLPGIAARIKSKNEIEIRQYLRLFEDILAQRAGNPHQIRWEDIIETHEYPAAREVSQACCDALEEAADDLSKRIERYEAKVERRKWGEDHWVVDARLAKTLYENNQLAREQGLHFSLLFRLPVWLRLSEDLFMNSPDPESNWETVADEEPSIQSTALEDFHTLVVSLTKKLVASTLYVAQSRIKAKRAIKPDIKGIVKKKDAEAAIASLGLDRNLQRHFATCARRLRLEVYDDKALTEEDGEPLSYDAVEELLLPHDEPNSWGFGRSRPRSSNNQEHVDFDLSDPDDDDDADSDSSTSDTDTKPPDNPVDATEATTGVNKDEAAAIRAEAKEVLLYSAREFPETLRTREALEFRIRREREQERYADHMDDRADQEEEAQLWRVMQRQPPVPPAKLETVERPPKSTAGMEDMHKSGARWREGLVYRSEWETLGGRGA
ncbi:hypothetical protein F5X68DRAFT_275629 [Plectosphaerella plurivora]|uniref:Myb-like domain-containing protein n=1 Tax=Plectosphaerella plurivora TaxID=936078 RepID=A0A9P8VCY7_9PEZI|nr:hypothetical protein F5X68DRAFT_275629 [Plectosphaerella plurivora]